jgi:RTX calcium-binding nonapeptide repeat (4 copies)
MTMRIAGRFTPSLVLAVLASVLVPAAAGASRVEVVTECETRSCAEVSRFVAGNGERNGVSVSEVGEVSVTFRDTGSTISVGRGCRSIDANTAACQRRPPGAPVGAGIGGEIRTGDRDDEVQTSNFWPISAGSGDDRVTVSGPAAVFGGRGDDRIAAVGGSDQELHGDSGNDRLRAARGGSDLDGGSGRDRLVGGAARDELSGGSGGDRLGGRGGRDVLGGGRGNDRLSGGGGGDLLRGNSGNDRLLGGSGADRLFGGSGRDLLLGGPGRDRLRGGPGRDRARQ